jgi:hypothetical protein
MFMRITIGLLVGLFFSYYAVHSYKKLLVLKSRPIGRTPEFIDGKFYYIVGEDEYVDMSIKALKK